MNSTIETINNRVSLRRYSDMEISKEHLDIILKSAIKAPTAGNMMMYSIIKITDENTKNTLSRTCDNQPFIAKAPIVLIFLADVQKWFDYFKVCSVDEIAKENNREVKPPGMNDLMLSINDALIACQNAVIAAESLGIGSCYIGDIMENYEIHKELLNLPDYTFPAAMITLGYYPENMTRVHVDRFNIDHVVFDEKYKTLNDDDLKEMFKVKEEKMPKTNPFNANNYGQLIYMRKTSSDFSIEMNRSIKECIKYFTGEIES